jgi:hypothetical protein
MSERLTPSPIDNVYAQSVQSIFMLTLEGVGECSPGRVTLISHGLVNASLRASAASTARLKEKAPPVSTI